MCAPMSPSAPEPARSFCSRQASGVSGSTSQSCRYCARTCRIVPSRPSCDELAGERDRRHPAVGEADHRADACARGPLGGRDHRLGLRDGVGQRLLAQHVLAGLERGDRDLGVGVARRADVDEVDVVARDQRPPVGLDVPPSRSGAAASAAARRVPPADATRSGAAAGRRSAARAPGLRVGGPHEGVADHADPEAAGRALRPRMRRGGVDAMRPSTSCVRGGGARRPERRRAPVRGQDSKASGRYWSTLSLVTTGALSTTRLRHLDLDQVATCPCSARSGGRA